MAPKGYDRYMLQIGAGTNRKFARLTDSERCAHVLGILSIAAQAHPRGYLLVADGEEAGPEEIASEAGGGVTVKVAKSAMEKLRRVGVLEWDPEIDAWHVHDWEQLNPAPRKDETAADRQRRRRDKLKHIQKRNASRVTSVTSDRDTPVTGGSVTPLEVEGEVEGEERQHLKLASQL